VVRQFDGARAARARRLINAAHTTGERAADAVAGAVGSWRFIIIQSCLLAAWMALNVVAFARHWDPYPFILLNLALSFQAAYSSPIIMMSQNRQAQKDRLRDDHEAEEVDLLYQINQQQLEILTLLHRGLLPPGAQPGGSDAPRAAQQGGLLPSGTRPADAAAATNATD
jgi:uncharacterized membrane protein